MIFVLGTRVYGRKRSNLCVPSVQENFEDEIFVRRGELTHPEPRLTNVLVRVTVNWWNLHLRAWIRALGGALKLTFYSEMNLKEFSSRKL